MKLQFNKNSKLFFPNYGLFEPGQIIEVEDKSIMANKMIRTGCFDKVKNNKPIKIKIKKSKK